MKGFTNRGDTVPVLKKVSGLTARESENLFNYFHDLVTYGHDLQVRLKWHEAGDIGKLFTSPCSFMHLLMNISNLGQ